MTRVFLKYQAQRLYYRLRHRLLGGTRVLVPDPFWPGMKYFP